MSLVINSNVTVLAAQRQLGISSVGLQSSLQKLSSGYKINRAADDAAGLRISETLRTQIRGNQKALQNVQDGTNVLNIAEGSYSTITDSFQRMRELLIQAVNDTNGSNERQAIDQELTQLKTTITQIASSSTFNGKNILTGALTNFRVQLGANSTSANNTINMASVFASAVFNAFVYSVKTAYSHLAVSAPSQAANGSTAFGRKGTFTTSGRTYSQIQQLINLVDGALSTVGRRRALIGAFQNRLDAATQAIGIRVQNYSASESAIRNVDVATENSNMTRYQILQQAGVSVLSQANNSSQLALQLLRG